MKQAEIEYEGIRRKVQAIHWNSDGSIAHACFYEANGEYRTAFQKTYRESEGFDIGGNLQLDLAKRLKEDQ